MQGGTGRKSAPKRPEKGREREARPALRPDSPSPRFCLFSSNEKIIANILQKPLDNTEFVWYNTKLQYNRITMGNSALRQVSRSKRGDFWRRSLCNLTKARSLRSIRLRPRHLKCPWVVRLTHEAPDVQTPVFRGSTKVVPHRYTPHPTPAAAREFARRCHRITI